VRKSILDGYDPAINHTEKPYPYQNEALSTDIRRFEPVSPNSFALAGFGASVDWLLDEVGAADAFAAIAGTVSYVRDGLKAIDGITLITPGSFAGLIALKSAKGESKELLAFLNERNIFARTVDPFGYLRLSFSYFITQEEADRLLKAVKEFSK
jgi:selenocysteine lyase/cysteine desulfurase